MPELLTYTTLAVVTMMMVNTSATTTDHNDHVFVVRTANVSGGDHNYDNYLLER